MELDPNFVECIKSFHGRDVRFLVVGGYAVAFHGHPRYTSDLDLWLWVDQTNAERVIAALEDFGFGELGLRESDFLDENRVVQLGYPPVRVDLLTSLDGVDFTGCHERRVEADLGGVTVPFISLDDLLANKRSSGRHQDLADLEALDQD